MLTIDASVEIVAGNIVYNPAENARYKVIDFGPDNDLRAPFLHLDPLPPYGSSIKPFRISLGSIIALGYVLLEADNMSA